MLLTEFFKPSFEPKQKKDKQDPKINDDLFWFMIDHDRLHKDYFFPIAKKLRKLENYRPEMILNTFMPMVIKGCREYYADKKMQGKLGKVFSKDLREEMCKRLYDHYKDDIKKDVYKLG